MAYLSLYNRWRPQNFSTIVGQTAMKQALTNAIHSNRIAHAYLFSGPRGTGKTSTARILAKALNCLEGPTTEPCGVCANCQRITAGTSMDVYELDAASNRGIDDVKNLLEQMTYSPVDGKYKIYIIDEVHMLTTEAFNALLKTLEEPPEHVIFILATTDPHKIPPTIHSRCQRFDFHRITVEEIVEHLAMVAEKSNIKAEREALRLIAIQSEGGMRDALSLLDQCGVMAELVTTDTVRQVLGIVGREALREMVQAMGQGQLGKVLEKLNQLLEQGKAVKQILAELSEYLRAVLLYKAAPDFEEVYLTDTKEALEQASKLFGQERILAAEERIHQALQELKGAMRAKVTAELCLFDLCREEGNSLAALRARLERLERNLQQGSFVRTAQAQAQEQQNKPIEAEAQTFGQGMEDYPPLEDIPPMEGDYPDLENLEPEEDFTFETASPVKPKPVATKTAEAKPSVEVKPVAEAKPSTPKFASQKSVAAGKSKNAPGEKLQTAVEEYGGDWATGEDYWKQALELLSNEKKISIVSCAKNGRVISFDQGKLVVAYKIPFMAERMSKDDFRGTVEDALLRIARQAIHLECIGEGTKPAAVPQRSKIVVTKPSKSKPSVPEGLENIVGAFGGDIKNID